MDVVSVGANLEEKEYVVTIPLEKYTDLIIAQRELNNLINFIFNTSEYNAEYDKLSISICDIEMYLKTIWGYEYEKAKRIKKSLEK